MFVKSDNLHIQRLFSHITMKPDFNHLTETDGNIFCLKLHKFMRHK